MLFREFFRLLKLECTCSLSYFQISQNINQTQAKTFTVMMTLFQQNLDVPMTPLNQRLAGALRHVFSVIC